MESSDLSQMVAAYNTSGIGQVMVEEVPDEMVERYGIVDCNGATLRKGDYAEISQLVEKPKQQDAPSNLSINGRYILPNRIMSLLKHTQSGAGGEIQLTDALDNWLEEGQLMAYNMKGKSYDCGNKSGYLEANIIYGLEHPETRDQLKVLLQKLAQSE
jgi:UTP--glucose-1-phosphate uridylyltransferase